MRARSAARLIALADALLVARPGAPWTPLVPAQLLVSAGPVEKEPVGGPVGDGGGGSMPLPPSGTTLVIRMRGAHTGLTVRPSCRSGGIRLRVIGAAALAVPPSVAAIPGGKSGAGSSAPGLWSSTNALSADAGVWQGERHFASAADEYAAVATALAGVHRRLQLEAAARAVCALDIGVSRTLPPGTASVAASAAAELTASQLVPPFAPLERRAPRRFLTLAPPPPALVPLPPPTPRSPLYVRRSPRAAAGGADAHPAKTSAASASLPPTSAAIKRPRLTYATTSDSLVFIQETAFFAEVSAATAAFSSWGSGGGTGSPTTITDVQPTAGADGSIALVAEEVDRYAGTAAAAAAWAVAREAVERRLRRDSLLRAFAAANVASALPSPASLSSHAASAAAAAAAAASAAAAAAL
eukprot:contig_23442_g5782